MTDQTTTTPDDEIVDLVYRVERDETGDPDTKLLTYGTQRIDVDDVPAYVVQRAYESRIAHFYTGPLTVTVWRARADEHYRLPVPDNAATYCFPTGQPTADELDLDDEQPEPCGESGCICHCGQGHVCSCDCWRCGDCQQHAENCQCDEED